MDFGPDFTPLTVKKPVVDIDINYNDDLKEMHEYLLGKLRKKKESGLVLLHGEPGTGKSTYIRHLICQLKKKVVFLPPSLAATLDSPSLTNIITRNENCLFIIEDAEELIRSREGTGESKISMLLNLTDGILGETVGSMFLCTFNTDLKNIDEALLRKGRLVASYKFENLELSKLRRLRDHLGLQDFEVTEGMALSDLYHSYQNRFGKTPGEKKKIGFQNQ
jgi:SpoVK/Ycf46/Vps4 family AAA+-type ATPase